MDSLGGSYMPPLWLPRFGVAAVWVMVGWLPGLAALTQTSRLVVMSADGLIFARPIIPDPPGMVIKSFVLLLLAWIVAALGSLPGSP